MKITTALQTYQLYFFKNQLYMQFNSNTLLLLLTGFPAGKRHHWNTNGISVCCKHLLWQVIYENHGLMKKGNLALFNWPIW